MNMNLFLLILKWLINQQIYFFQKKYIFIVFFIKFRMLKLVKELFNFLICFRYFCIFA